MVSLAEKNLGLKDAGSLNERLDQEKLYSWWLGLRELFRMSDSVAIDAMGFLGVHHGPARSAYSMGITCADSRDGGPGPSDQARPASPRTFIGG